MREIIAKKTSIGWGYILGLGSGVLCLVFGAVYTSSDKVPGIIIAMLGLVVALTSVYLLLRVRKVPKVIICREGDTLIFPDGECKISALTNVYCRRATNRGVACEWGKIILNTDGGEYKYDFVADVEKVQGRLNYLMLESRSENPNYEAGAFYG